jgi:hypothetical protein
MNLVEKKSMEHEAGSLEVGESRRSLLPPGDLHSCTPHTTRKAICYVRVNFLASLTLYPLMCQERSSQPRKTSR